MRKVKSVAKYYVLIALPSNFQRANYTAFQRANYTAFQRANCNSPLRLIKTFLLLLKLLFVYLLPLQFKIIMIKFFLTSFLSRRIILSSFAQWQQHID